MAGGFYYKPATRPEGPMRCPDRGNAGGLFVFFTTFEYYLSTLTMAITITMVNRVTMATMATMVTMVHMVTLVTMIAMGIME